MINVLFFSFFVDGQVLETYFGAEEEGQSEIVPDLITGAGGTQQFGFGSHNTANPPGGFQF